MHVCVRVRVRLCVCACSRHICCSYCMTLDLNRLRQGGAWAVGVHMRWFANGRQ